MEENQKQSTWDKFKFNNTLAVLENLVQAFNKVLSIVSIISPLIMMAYYTYTVISHISTGGYLLILNSIMLGLIVISFIVDRIFARIDKEKKKLKKYTKRTFEYTQFSVKLLLTAFAVYEIIVSKTSALKVIFTFVTVGFVFVQIFVKAVTIVIENYIAKVKIAFQMDLEEIKSTKLYQTYDKTKNIITKTKDLFKNLPAKTLEFANKKMSKFGNDFEEAKEPNEPELEPTKTSKKEEKTREKITLLADARKERKADEKAIKKEEEKLQRKNRLLKATQEFRSFLGGNTEEDNENKEA